MAVEAQVAESARDLKVGNAADINCNEVGAHQPGLKPQRCVRYDQELELEILNEWLHAVENCISEAAPPNA